MGNSASNPTNQEYDSNKQRRNPNLQQPFVDLSSKHGEFLYSSSTSSISRTSCDAGPPPAAGVVAPPPLPLPTMDPKAAVAAPPPPPPSSVLPPPSPESDAIAQAAASTSRYNNPGPYEQAALQAKHLVQLDSWEGFRCEVSKQMNPFMGVTHGFGMAPASGESASPMRSPPSSYTMGTQVVDDSGVLSSRLDTARGGVYAQVNRMLFGGLAVGKLDLNLSGTDYDMFLAEIDIGTPIPALTWTANFKYGSVSGRPVWGANYWQAITPQLTMGADGMYNRAQGGLSSTYAAKYTFQAPLTEEEKEEAALKIPVPGPPGMPQPDPIGASQLCATFHTANGLMTLNYRRVITPSRVLVGAELTFPLFHPMGNTPEVLLGAEFNFTRSKLRFGFDASAWKLTSTLETRLGMGQSAPRFGLCAAVDHVRQDYKFGYAINIEN